MRPVKHLAILASLFSSAAVAQAEPLFFESFENGNGAWHAADDNEIVITSDTETCSTKYQHETVPCSTGGRVLSNFRASVTGGGQYCVSAWVRASSDSLPMIGVEPFDIDGNSAGDQWLVGSTYYGAQVDVVADDTWHWYAANLTVDATAATLGVKDMMFTGSGYADFDDIAITAGPCAEIYTGADQHQVCSGDAPVCSADGSCQAVAPPPSDMGGGPSSTPDMGSSGGSSGGSSTFPGSNQALNPPPASTPVAAEGMPSGAGAVTASGGCSMGGSEGERSFGLMLLAAVAVMFAGRRRRA
ncbi:MAG: hypothetical protein JWM53_485 [bacterium]|nr:hypothetical protein [bacterium]